MSDIEPDGKKKHLFGMLGVFSFVLVLVLAVGTTGVLSLKALMSDEEAVREIWAEIQLLQDRRLELVAGMVFELGENSWNPAGVEEWRSAQTEADMADSFNEEVTTQLRVDEAVERLMTDIRESVSDSLRFIIEQYRGEIEEQSRELAVKYRLYNEAVETYTMQLSRIPGRWMALLVGFDKVIEYGRTGG